MAKMRARHVNLDDSSCSVSVLPVNLHF